MHANGLGSKGVDPRTGRGVTAAFAAGGRRIFLLSPANLRGIRAARLLAGGSSEIARRFADGPVPLGEVFSFLSGLYFRGKLAYARAFGSAPGGVDGSLVITARAGLLPSHQPVTREQLAEISAFANRLKLPRRQ